MYVLHVDKCKYAKSHTDASDGYHINDSHPFHMEVGNCQQVLYTFTTPCVSALLLENMGTNANLSFAI